MKKFLYFLFNLTFNGKHFYKCLINRCLIIMKRLTAKETTLVNDNKKISANFNCKWEIR